MAMITLGQLRDLWKNVSDWVTGASASKPDVRAQDLEVLVGATDDPEAAGDGSVNAILKRIRTLLTSLEGKDFATETTMSTTLSSLDSHLAALETAVGERTDPETAGDGSVIAIIKRLRTLLGNLDAKDYATQTTLATLATEATLQACQTLLTSLDGKDYATQTTLSSADGHLGNLDTDIGAPTDAEAAGDGSVIAILKRLRTLLGSLDGKDYATETTLALVATEATLQAVQNLLTGIKDTDGVKKITDPLPAGDNNIGNVDALIADGADVAQGATTDVAQTDPAQNATAIALLKGLLSQLQGTGSGAAPAATVGQTTTKQVTIAQGTSLSDEVDLEGYKLVAIKMPAAWDAANLTFQACEQSGGTFVDLYDDTGNEITVTADANRVISIDGTLAPLRYIKIRSGTSSVPVNQGAERTLTLILKG